MTVTAQVIADFDDPAVGPGVWSTLLEKGNTRDSILTWQAQRSWWQENQHLGRLLLILACQYGEPQAIAPLFIAGGMAMNLCPVNSLDFVGDIASAELLDAIIETARRETGEFAGLRFHFIPHTSHTGRRLQEAADRLGLACNVEDEQPSPIIDLERKREEALSCTRKKTVLRRENHLRRVGTLAVHHFRDAKDVLPQLEEFFEQHVDRWAGTSTPSKFRDQRHRDSFRWRTTELADAGWLRFSRLDCGGSPIAFHRGTCFQGHFRYGRASFARDMAAFSPGTVLLRHVLLSAIEEGAHTFDFGIGDESYKFRYATDVIRVQTWGLYPSR